jgi:NitT/TauT family transport system ATP-binding protein
MTITVPGNTLRQAVSIKDVSFGYGDINVLENVSVDISEGEFLSIVGPSGCGKTTLLNCVAGFAFPDHGEIRLRGHVVDNVAAGKAAFMFAKDTLLPWRTAFGNIELAVILRDKHVRKVAQSRSAVRAEVNSLLDRVGLKGAGNKKVDELSHGMRQRVALARTLAMDAPLILMDEPFGALDAQTRVNIQNEFLKVWEQERRTVVLITHDIAEAIVMSDRIIVLGGKPARVLADLKVDLPRPRNVTQIHSENSMLFQEIWKLLEVAGSPSAEDTP